VSQQLDRTTAAMLYRMAQQLNWKKNGIIVKTKTSNSIENISQTYNVNTVARDT